MAYIGKQPKKLGAGEDLPPQENKSGQFLTTDGTDESWAMVVTKTSLTGAAQMPVGNTSERVSIGAAGMFRYNSETGDFEGFTNEWGAIAGDGGATTFPFYKANGTSDTIAITNGEFPFFLADGTTQDNIAVT